MSMPSSFVLKEGDAREYNGSFNFVASHLCGTIIF